MPNIIVAGSTPVNRRKTIEVLDKVTSKAKGVIKFIFPLPGLEDSDLPKVAEIIASYVLSNEGEFQVTFIVPEGSTITEGSTAEELNEAGRLVVFEVGDDETALDVAFKTKKAILLAVWDDEDADVADAVAQAVAKGIPARDITNDLEPIVIPAAEEQDEEEPGEEPEDEPAEPGSPADFYQALTPLVEYIVARVKADLRG